MLSNNTGNVKGTVVAHFSLFGHELPADITRTLTTGICLCCGVVLAHYGLSLLTMQNTRRGLEFRRFPASRILRADKVRRL